MKGRTKYHGYAVNSWSGIGKVTTKDIFPYELAFAMTVHKAQGRTIPRVVLALAHRENSNNQMSYASIYVALSRVKLTSDLRIMYHDTGPRPGLLGLQYITHLKHCVHVLDYYNDFPRDTNGGLWNPRSSLAAKNIRQHTNYY
jgi:Viral (Superfamily 1) RNA helicase